MTTTTQNHTFLAKISVLCPEKYQHYYDPSKGYKHFATDIKDLIEEMETIVFSGTKLNIKYYLEEIFDEDQLNELYEYFIESDSNSIKLAEEEFKGEYDEEELRLYRLKFMSEIAN